jgi:hypothetical protein
VQKAELDRWKTFVETTQFTNNVTVEVLRNIQLDLVQNPERGAIIKGANGARKARVADGTSGRGKSGGQRYLYLHLEQDGVIYLLFIFAKNDQANLSAQQKRKIADWVKNIKERYDERRS